MCVRVRVLAGAARASTLAGRRCRQIAHGPGQENKESFLMTFSLPTAVRTYARRTWSRRDVGPCTKLGLVVAKVAASVGYAWGKKRPAIQFGPAASACR